MARKYVNYEIEDRIAIVTVDRPPVNALSLEVVDELSEVFDELGANKDAGAVVIAGGGKKAFVAGADITMFEEFMGNRAKALESVRKMQDCFTRIENFDMVVIAAINGLALGGGCELAVACDIRVAAENAMIGTPEVKLGIIPGAGGTQRLTRLLGKGWAKMIVLGGDPVSASEALSIGLVEKVVPTGEALIESKKLAKVFLKRGPLALKNGKRAINEGSNMTLEEGLIREAELITELFLTEDVKEGAEAFFEKRSPVFRGR